MSIETLKIQLTLNAENPREKAIIDYINDSGKRSGVPKQLIMQGYDNLKGVLSGNKTDIAHTKPVKAISKPNLNAMIAG